ncbi:MAG: tripartite tricarboxylate transporter TctB family protein [Syntrophales bacterium]
MMDIRDMISGIVCLLISVFVVMTSLRLGVGALHDPGPGFILFWAGILLAICSCILFGISLVKKTAPVHRSSAENGGDRRNVIIAVAALLAYCLVLPKLGYRISTFALMLVLFSLGKMKPWAVILGSLIAVLTSYYLFDRLLQTPLPRGVLRF